ncbi:hypothetical protein SO802_025429 [Lithocarpus litseifolius]|uniref:Uncharacterized protein n=1 Tax=Lithocarpus litseifolius TaxID=425828 RepID=A0AAW2BWT9_9ROSI
MSNVVTKVHVVVFIGLNEHSPSARVLIQVKWWCSFRKLFKLYSDGSSLTNLGLIEGEVTEVKDLLEMLMKLGSETQEELYAKPANANDTIMDDYREGLKANPSSKNPALLLPVGR